MNTPIDSLVLDLSNYDADTFDARAFYAAGVRRAIVGSQQPSLSGPMVQALRSEGVEIIGTYDLPYFGSDETTQRPIERAVAFAEQYKIPRVWVDAEIDANQTNVWGWQRIPTPSVSQRQAEFRWCMDLVKAHAPTGGIYTNGGWWVPNMANTAEWSAWALWLATYGVGGAPIGPIVDVAFGGWSKASLHQYTSTWLVNGRGRDCSYLFDGEQGTGNGEQQREDEMTDDEIRAIVADQTAKTVTALFNAGAPPFFRHYVDLCINPREGGFSDGQGGLLPAVQDAALVARVDELESSPAGNSDGAVPAHTHPLSGTTGENA